jgi:hypothetical protein
MSKIDAHIFVCLLVCKPKKMTNEIGGNRVNPNIINLYINKNVAIYMHNCRNPERSRACAMGEHHGGITRVRSHTARKWKPATRGHREISAGMYWYSCVAGIVYCMH